MRPITPLRPQIQEAHPLKQGLKLNNFEWKLELYDEIQEAHPLKQGLKQF